MKILVIVLLIAVFAGSVIDERNRALSRLPSPDGNSKFNEG